MLVNGSWSEPRTPRDGLFAPAQGGVRTLRPGRRSERPRRCAAAFEGAARRRGTSSLHGVWVASF